MLHELKPSSIISNVVSLVKFRPIEPGEHGNMMCWYVFHPIVTVIESKIQDLRVTHKR